MVPAADPTDLLGRAPDERLLGEDVELLPAAYGRPEPLPESPARRRIVGLGATLTGVTLIGGIALGAIGVVVALSGDLALAIVLLVLGAILIATHWGWVHVAELGATRLEARRNSTALDLRRHWLAAIEPYPRWEVGTSSGPDGSITILTTCHRPVPAGDRTFSFVCEEAGREVHSGDEPAAGVAERAELLRRQAAAETERARELYEVARDAYDRALLEHDDEQQRLAAVRAASEALSDRLNAKLREPPLME